MQTKNEIERIIANEMNPDTINKQHRYNNAVVSVQQGYILASKGGTNDITAFVAKARLIAAEYEKDLNEKLKILEIDYAAKAQPAEVSRPS